MACTDYIGQERQATPPRPRLRGRRFRKGVTRRGRLDPEAPSFRPAAGTRGYKCRWGRRREAPTYRRSPPIYHASFFEASSGSGSSRVAAAAAIHRGQRHRTQQPRGNRRSADPGMDRDEAETPRCPCVVRMDPKPGIPRHAQLPAPGPSERLLADPAPLPCPPKNAATALCRRCNWRWPRPGRVALPRRPMADVPAPVTR